VRERDGELVVEPASLVVHNWKQNDYIGLWEGFIDEHASRILLIPGWEYSAGCVAEFCRARLNEIPRQEIDGTAIVTADAVAAIRAALSRLEAMSHPPVRLLKTLHASYAELKKAPSAAVVITELLRKDQSLDRLAELINVAQFVSFEPRSAGPRQTYSRILGKKPNFHFRNMREAAEALLATSAEDSANVRSFTPASPLSREFIYGLHTVDDIVSAVERLSGEGLNTIINETVDIRDGGVSGVVLGGVIEFAPDDTPRAVEKPGIASLPRGLGISLLTTVYGFKPDLSVPSNLRLEFSIHPKPRGWRHSHTIGWEIAEAAKLHLPATVTWPNRFSRMVGDKVFGLLIGHHIGLPVPRSTAISRRVAPFTFGRPTGTNEIWLRTAPNEQMPGRYATKRGWVDPFVFMASEDPEHKNIASIISQAGVFPEFSGASIVSRNGQIFTEGVKGSGEAFMMGISAPEELSQSVLKEVEALHVLASQLGPVRFEWVYDGNRAWVVQLHQGATVSEPDVLVPGEAVTWVPFNVSEGLSALRETLAALEPESGLMLTGAVGLTSHIADVIRKANVPARITSPTRLKVA
jgi:hypothetical protein